MLNHLGKLKTHHSTLKIRAEHACLCAQLVAIFFNDRIRQQFFAHSLYLSLSLNLVLLIQIHFHVLPDSHIARILEPQRIERMLNRFPLWIENPLLERHMNLGLHLSLPHSEAYLANSKSSFAILL